MGAAWGHMRRWMINWNFENRALKFVDRQKKFAPPRYPTEAKVEQKIRREPHPEIDAEVQQKADVLLDHLRKIVYSNSIPPAKAETIVKYFAPFATQKYAEIIRPEEAPMTPGEAYITMSNVFKTKRLQEKVTADERTKFAAFETREKLEEQREKAAGDGGKEERVEQIKQEEKEEKRKKELQDAEEIVKKI